MTEPILCPECGHGIDKHESGEYCNGCFWESDIGAVDCALTPYDIARAHGEGRFNEGWDACELRWAVRHSE